MKLYCIYLPKIYNNGKEIESKKITEVTERIRKKFGAYSLDPFARLPIIQGMWTSDKTNRVYSEPMIKVELFIEDTFDNQKWLKSFKEIVRQDLGQEEIFMIVQNAEILKD